MLYLIERVQAWLPWNPQHMPAVAEYYDSNQYWPAESLQRRQALRKKS